MWGNSSVSWKSAISWFSLLMKPIFSFNCSLDGRLGVGKIPTEGFLSRPFIALLPETYNWIHSSEDSRIQITLFLFSNLGYSSTIAMGSKNHYPIWTACCLISSHAVCSEQWGPLAKWRPLWPLVRRGKEGMGSNILMQFRKKEGKTKEVDGG